MKLKEAINRANKRDGFPLMRDNCVYLPGLATPLRVMKQKQQHKKRKCEKEQQLTEK